MGHYIVKFKDNNQEQWGVHLDGKIIPFAVLDNAKQMNIPVKNERILKSAKMQEDWKVLTFQDPDKHWIEIVYK